MRRAVYVISVAADLTGVHPQTLRAWERSGLLRPERSQGGARRYSDEDIALARRARQLLAQGLSVQGVRAVLHLERELAAARAEVVALREELARLLADAGQGPSGG